MKEERNYSIDLLKFICAVLVVFLHTPCIYHKFINPITRCAVPCFFIISGYLLYNKNGINPERLKRNLVHILNINIGATLSSLCFNKRSAISPKGRGIHSDF